MTNTEHPRTGKDRAAWLLGMVLVLSTLAVLPEAVQADSDPVDPSDPATPKTVTADGLPTTQIDGVVWSQAIVGNRVFAGGAFATARPAGASPGTDEVTRNNLLAYDIRTGKLDASFSPNLNAQVTSVAVSPDGSRVYVGGDFTSVNGERRGRIAAFNAETGALVASFAPPVTGSVDAIVATNSTVYAGGSFLGVGNQERTNLAAFGASNGALLDWAPQAAGGTVRALTMSPDRSKLVVGGSFTSLNGSSNPGYGLAMVNATTGTSLPFAVNSLVRNGTSDSAITSLSSDGDNVYGTGYNFGGGGNLEGVFAADWGGGAVHWINDCHGDSYSVHPQGDVIYQASHSHYCENIGGFRQSTYPSGGWKYYRATATSKAATGTVGWDPTDAYFNFEGNPAPSPVTWYPALNTGEATGQFQGPWNVTGNHDYIVMGGEFTKVNDRGQQGLVRFAMKENAPNDRGPELSAGTYPIKAASPEPGKVWISWAANYDQDNRNLTYRVYRDTQDSDGLVHTRQAQADFWALPGMGFRDTGMAPGSTHRYRVSATDSSGNVANSPWVDVTVATAAAESRYQQAVRASQPTHYWRFGESSGSVADDAVGWSPATTHPGVSRGVPGAIAGDDESAAGFNGTSAGYAATTTEDSPPDRFSLEAWFKTTTAGGKIVGWGNRNDRGSGKADRHLYLDDEGRVTFGVKPDASRDVVTSTDRYDDGQWHMAAASLGRNGMKLYVDGALVGERSDVTVGEHLSRGFWRIGGDTLIDWPDAPSNPYFTGDIDEVAVYSAPLSAAEIAEHYAIGTGGAGPPNVAPRATFTEKTRDLSLDVDASESGDSDGSIASLAWDFGDGHSASGVRTSHTYAGAGTYQVSLTVTDDDGESTSRTERITVPEARDRRLLAHDDFERTVLDGLGAALFGGDWNRTGSAQSYGVSGDAATIRTGAPGREKSAYLGSVSSANTNLSVDLALDKRPADGNAQVTAIGRRIDKQNEYSAALHYNEGGEVRLSLVRKAAGTSTQLRSVVLPRLAVRDSIRLRTQVTGRSPTRIRARAWEIGKDQPRKWQLSVKDSRTSLQKRGAVGVGMGLGADVTNAPLVASIDELNATRP